MRIWTCSEHDSQLQSGTGSTMHNLRVPSTRFPAAIAAIVVVLMATSVVPASADARLQPVAGTFEVSSLSVTGAVPVEGTCRIGLTATFTFTGSLLGAFKAPFRIVKFGPCEPSFAAT